MAEWKKIVVSGSGLAQLANDANFLTTTGNGSGLTNVAAASVAAGNVTGLNEAIDDQVNSVLGSADGSVTLTYNDAAGTLDLSVPAGDVTGVAAGAGLTGGGAAGDVTLNVIGGDGITANADELEVTVDGSSIELSATDGTGAVRVKAGGIAEGHLADDSVTAAKLADSINADILANTNKVGISGAQATAITNNSAKLTNATHSGEVTGAGTLTIANGAVVEDRIADNAVTAAKLADTAVTAGTYGSTTVVPGITVDAQGRITGVTSNTIATSFNVAADAGTTDLVAGGETLTFEGGSGIKSTVSANKVSFELDAGVVSGSNFSAPSQGTMRSGINGVNTDVDLGLQTTDSPTFVGLTLSGNATVAGNLSVSGDLTYINTTNLAVTDKFILLNSGSANPDEGGIIIDEGNGVGHGFVFDNSDSRFGVNQSVDSKVNGTAANEAYVALVVDEDNSAHDIADTEYHKRGNMKVNSSDDIFIYV